MQRLTYGISLGHYYGKDNSRFHVGTSLAPRPMIVVFGFGMRLCVQMRTSLETGVLRNGSSRLEL